MTEYTKLLRRLEYNYNDFYDEFKITDEQEIIKLQHKIMYHESLIRSFKRQIIEINKNSQKQKDEGNVYIQTQ